MTPHSNTVCGSVLVNIIQQDMPALIENYSINCMIQPKYPLHVILIASHLSTT